MAKNKTHIGQLLLYEFYIFSTIVIACHSTPKVYGENANNGDDFGITGKVPEAVMITEEEKVYYSLEKQFGE